MNTDKIKIAIADDHVLFRTGIKNILENHSQFEIVIEADNGKELIDQIEEQPDSPHLVLLDIRMPLMNGFETAEKLIETFPSVKIIVLSMHDEARHIIRMIELGANGYLLKSARPEEVIGSIEMVMENDYYFNDKINALMRKVIRFKNQPTTGYDIPVALTKREREVLDLICKEYTTKEIGDKLFLSARTVEGHRKNLVAKLNVKNIAGLVVYAIKHDLVKV